MRKLNSLWALLLSVLFVVGCNPDTPEQDQPGPGNDPVNTEKPELTLTQTELTFDSFQMYILQGMKPEKIASALGISVATVYVHKSRCMAYLKKAAAKIQQSDPGFTL